MIATTASVAMASPYTGKPSDYFAGARHDFIERLPKNSKARILEVGCGSGETGALALEGKRAGHYTGIELMPSPAAEAAKRLSEVLVGNIEELKLDWAPQSFDALILSEVLEHLVNPRDVVRRLAPLVKPGGVVLASSPNIAHWRVLRQLISGHFPAEDKGVFDRTHLRWFTPITFSEMFNDAGFEIVSSGPVTPFASRTKIISKLTAGRLDHLFTAQIFVEGRRL